MRTTSIIIVDDHPIVIAGIKVLLDSETNYTIVGSAHTPQEAIELSENLNPEIIILDLFINHKEGIHLIQRILSISPKSRILIYSTCDEFLYAERCVKSGAVGYLMKSKGLLELANAINIVNQGLSYLSEPIKTSIVDKVLGGRNHSIQLEGNIIDQLSNRELQILFHIGKGKTTGQIASQFHLSPKTIGAHKENIKNKLGINSSSELMKTAINLMTNQVNC